MITVSWNYANLDASLIALQEDFDAPIIFVEDAEAYDDSLELSISDAELLITKLRFHLDKIYTKEADESRGI